VSDVPLGAFLSGGIDSSVVVALASQLTDTRLRTFSIGYKDHPFFDETSYAIEVAKKFNVDHTVFSLTNDDFLQHLEDVLNSIDEPFADSSAIPLFILSKHTRRQVTVALSGDGGDEIFAGYNKHAAEYRLRIPSWKNELVRFGGPLWAALPKSRNSRIGNLVRQLDRFSKGAALNPKERYWQWAGFLSDSELSAFLKENPVGWEKAYGSRKDSILAGITGGEQMEDFLATDMSLVLLSDMLVKVDRMSMANSLEVRSPFLDHRVVEYAFSLPTRYKLGGGLKKRIVQDAFRSILPESLYNRPKKGFEIPLLDWFRKELRSRIQDEWLADRFVEEQGIFNVEATRKLKARLFSADPGDAHATVWALIVFQQWWKRTMSSFNHSSTGIE
jgi:asparagine synthase (glutamine-hydrolysing)